MGRRRRHDVSVGVLSLSAGLHRIGSLGLAERGLSRFGGRKHRSRGRGLIHLVASSGEDRLCG